MDIRPAREQDLPSILGLAAQVELWFGPMVDDPGFQRSVNQHILRSAALIAVAPNTEILGAVMFGVKAPTYRIHWLVVAEQQRGNNVGSALMTHATRRFTQVPGIIEVVTFGIDHPGATASGARAFYESLGFVPAEAAAPGPEGGSRQVYRKAIS
ncbi:GNAT family N-acetyltransferase [Nocardia sp. NBC_01329]|uniref:GNAT family N-acetyltransferase n=1 Tax=Nocardia sp. NBC_01329 TaxID=2903594 RepID=UPI002E148A3A|nr:GNAT family N-acetyltransferase [Nocardia sp. NBC_01329]